MGEMPRLPAAAQTPSNTVYPRIVFQPHVLSSYPIHTERTSYGCDSLRSCGGGVGGNCACKRGIVGFRRGFGINPEKVFGKEAVGIGCRGNPDSGFACRLFTACLQELSSAPCRSNSFPDLDSVGACIPERFFPVCCFSCCCWVPPVGTSAPRPEETNRRPQIAGGILHWNGTEPCCAGKSDTYP